MTRQRWQGGALLGILTAMLGGCTEPDAPGAGPVLDKDLVRAAKADGQDPCRAGGFPEGCDLCEMGGWYGDGQCDREFVEARQCWLPDPDCFAAPPVVGGGLESGYPAVGYLLAGDSRGAVFGPRCGATLVAPDVAVTAAHCVVQTGTSSLQYRHYAVGFGTVGSSPAIHAREVHVHPDFVARLDAPERYRHDVAILSLEEPVADVTPARIVYGEVDPIEAPEIDLDLSGPARPASGPAAEAWTIDEGWEVSYDGPPWGRAHRLHVEQDGQHIGVDQGAVGIEQTFDEDLGDRPMVVTWRARSGEPGSIHIEALAGNVVVARGDSPFDTITQTFMLPPGERRLRFRLHATSGSGHELVVARVSIGATGLGGCEDRGVYVGYGRSTAGDGSVATGYEGRRKSARQCVDEVDPLSIWARGEDGGLCWGDSGGPLLIRGTNQILGVLADFADLHFYCEDGNRMIFTSLAGEWDFVAPLLP